MKKQTNRPVVIKRKLNMSCITCRRGYNTVKHDLIFLKQRLLQFRTTWRLQQCSQNVDVNCPHYGPYQLMVSSSLHCHRLFEWGRHNELEASMVGNVYVHVLRTLGYRPTDRTKSKIGKVEGAKSGSANHKKMNIKFDKSLHITLPLNFETLHKTKLLTVFES